MVFAACLALAFSGTIVDYFPLAAGTKWTYEDPNGAQNEVVVGETIDLGKGKSAIEETSTATGRTASLFQIGGDTAYVVGTLDTMDKKSSPNLLGEPHPILKIGASKATWTYLGELATGLGPVALTVKGESSPGPRRKVLGHEIETYDVHVISRIGSGETASEVRQDAIYGKGIGLVEVNEATKTTQGTVKKVLKLVKFEPAQG